MTLIEVIAVLAILAISAAVVLPMLIKDLDKAASDQEVATLQSFADAFQRRIDRYGYIPGPTEWTTNISMELGIAPSDVNANTRHLTRYLLFDPNFATALTIPYTQTSSGAGTAPTGARLMILSSLGKALPTMSSGIPANAADFSNIWNTASGTVPSATVFNNWGGSGDDLKIQRINLSSLFAHVMLSYYASVNNAWYSIGAGAPIAVNNLDAYFLKGSVLNLFTNSPALLNSQLIINDDTSCWYYQDAWRGLLPGTTGVPGSSANLPGAFDFSSIVNGFLNATPTSLGAGQQQLVVQDFINYMNAYTNWAGSGFTDQTNYNSAVQLQATMVNRINALVSVIP
jgi:type II secretory pathway pseudopilin PulG